MAETLKKSNCLKQPVSILLMLPGLDLEHQLQNMFTDKWHLLS